MTTTLYLRNTYGNPISSTVPQSASTQWVDDYSPGNCRGGDLSTSPGSSGAVYTYLYPTSTGPVTNPGTLIGFWSSLPVASAFTLSGTIAVDLWGYESSMSANATFRIVLWKVQPDGSSSVITNINYGTELGTSNAQVTLTATPTSTEFSAGDRIVIGVYAFDATSTSMGSGYYVYLYWNGSEGGTGDSQIRLTETVSFASSASGTTLKMLDTASDLGGAGQKKFWTDADGTQVNKVVDTIAYLSFGQWTDSAGGQVLEWLSSPLQAVTIEGMADILGAGLESNSNANVSPLYRVYKTDTDGTNPVLIGETRAYELSTSLSDIIGSLPIRGSLTDGQRLMVRVYTSSAINFSAPTFSIQPQFAGYTATLTLNIAGSAHRIKFPTTLTEYNATPPTIPTDYWGVAA